MKCLICNKEMEVWREDKYCSNLCTEKAVKLWQEGKLKRIPKTSRVYGKLEGKTREQVRLTLLHMIRTHKKKKIIYFSNELFLEYARFYEELRNGKGQNYVNLTKSLLGMGIDPVIKHIKKEKVPVIKQEPKIYVRNYLGKCRVCGTIIERDNTREMCGSVEHQSGCAWKVITYKKYKKYASIN